MNPPRTEEHAVAIQDQPHYVLPAAELAAWVERQGAETRWMVDGDPYLTGHVASPCRGDDLATVLRRSRRTLLLAATNDPDARGQRVTVAELDRLAKPLGESMYFGDPGPPKPDWVNDRSFWLSWQDDPNEWMLAEDSEATAALRDVETRPLVRVVDGKG